MYTDAGDVNKLQSGKLGELGRLCVSCVVSWLSHCCFCCTCNNAKGSLRFPDSHQMPNAKEHSETSDVCGKALT
ncbi:hypothetical protein ACLKA7_016517 [Drosophila subpalustris]